MHIVQVCNYIPPAKDAMGTERVVEAITKAFVAHGDKVTMLLHSSAKNSPVANVELTDTLDNADLVHYHGWLPDEYQKTKAPWVTTIHGCRYAQQENKSKELKKHIVAVSTYAAYRINAVQYAYNAVDQNEFTYQSDKGNYFLWLAGTDWGESKGLYTTIELCKTLKLNLKIAGTGRNKENIDYIKSQCSDKIQYLGAVNGLEKVNLIKNAKALFYLTRLDDACPVSVIEAMMCGTPVIGSKSGSMMELVLHNVTGFTCGNMHEIVHAVKALPKISTKICREYAVKRFSLNACYKSYKKIYNRIMENTDARSTNEKETN